MPLVTPTRQYTIRYTSLRARNCAEREDTYLYDNVVNMINFLVLNKSLFYSICKRGAFFLFSYTKRIWCKASVIV